MNWQTRDEMLVVATQQELGTQLVNLKPEQSMEKEGTHWLVQIE
jgi:hypothetical protein